MLRKFFSLFLAAILALIGLTASAPANATVPSETGDIYYWGAWDNATQAFRGMHRYNLDSMTDEALFAASPTCLGLVGEPAALAVDPAHNRVYWSITDGNAGVFALDLSTDTCYTVSTDSPVMALEVLPDTQTLVWSLSNGGIYLATTDVTDLTNIATPNYTAVDIPGQTVYGVSDLVLAEGKLFYMIYADPGTGPTGQIYSTDTNSIGANYTLERDTGLSPNPGQLQVTTDAFYYNIISAQIVKVPRDGSGLAGFLDVNQTAGFAIADGKMYTAKDRDAELKSIDLTNFSQAMTAMPGGAIPDFNGKLRYSSVTQGGLTAPTINAANTVSSAGTALVPFTGVTLTSNTALRYTVKAKNGSETLTGFCNVNGSNCQIDGLNDNKRYTVQLTMVYTVDNGGTLVATVGGVPSNLANINVAQTTYDPATCTATISDNPATTQSGVSPIVYASDGSEIGTFRDTYFRGDAAQGTNTDDGYTLPIELPFSLNTASGHSKIQISTNGVVNDNQDQTSIDVFNADLDGRDGYITAGLCSLNLNGVTKQAYFITWTNFEFYDQQNSAITMQLILIKTSAFAYKAIRNYSELSTNDTSDLTFGYMCPFVSNPAWCNRVVADLPNTDIPMDVAVGLSLISGGATDLLVHHTVNTSQLGRYVTDVDSNPTLCDTQSSKELTVSYAAAGAQAVDPSYGNVVTENFDSYAVGQLPSPATSPVGDFSGTITTFPANQFGGAGGTGNGAEVDNAIYTAPGNTCYKYFGFWWSAGSPNNAIQLLSSDDVVLATFTAADLYNNLTPPGASAPCPDATNAYCGNPADPANMDPVEPFAYINLRFPAGFKKIRLYVTDHSTGFEIDNISVSTAVPVGSANEHFLSGDQQALNPTTPPPPAQLKSTKTITGFSFEKPALSASGKAAIRAWLKNKSGYTAVTCVGYTGFNWNKRSNAYLTRLALTRATNVCNYIHQLKPSIIVHAKTTKRDTSKKDAARRVIATITN